MQRGQRHLPQRAEGVSPPRPPLQLGGLVLGPTEGPERHGRSQARRSPASGGGLHEDDAACGTRGAPGMGRKETAGALCGVFGVSNCQRLRNCSARALWTTILDFSSLFFVTSLHKKKLRVQKFIGGFMQATVPPLIQQQFKRQTQIPVEGPGASPPLPAGMKTGG